MPPELFLVPVVEVTPRHFMPQHHDALASPCRSCLYSFQEDLALTAFERMQPVLDTIAAQPDVLRVATEHSLGRFILTWVWRIILAGGFAVMPIQWFYSQWSRSDEVTS